MNASFSLSEAEQAITACLAANAGAEVDRTARLILDAHDEDLRWYLTIARLETLSPLGCDHAFGANYRGPALDDLIRSCEIQRNLGRARFADRSAAA